MTYIDVVRYCLAFPNTQRQVLSESGNAFGLMVGSTLFGHFETGAPVQWQFTLRVSAEDFVALPNPPHIRQAESALGGHWITIRRVENFDEHLLKNLIDWSFHDARQA